MFTSWDWIERLIDGILDLMWWRNKTEDAHWESQKARRKKRK